MNKKSTYKAFATHNNTDSWLIGVDGLMMLTDENTAKALFDSVIDVENSPFGCLEIIPPHSRKENCFGEEYQIKAFDCQQADVAGYMAKALSRQEKRMFLKTREIESAKARWNDAISWGKVFGNTRESYLFSSPFISK